MIKKCQRSAADHKLNIPHLVRTPRYVIVLWIVHRIIITQSMSIGICNIQLRRNRNYEYMSRHYFYYYIIGPS